MANEPSGHPAPQPLWLSSAQQRAWRAFMDGHQRLMVELNRQLEDDSDLSLPEYRILVMLSESPGGSLRMSDLADGVLSSRSRLTHQIRRMEEQGMVRRTSCEEDGRGVRAHLTEEGMRRLVAAAPGHVAAVRRAFLDLISPDELDAIGDAFERVDNANDRRRP
ncbi:MarR family winged helix-turn-helix transcriptional regulator [Nocardia spumae]|uniref:MarR family winged helix-turn-helix transcriptional regulator n=1 Tax=Nocardia spumae TaxID=2887190 RepID=UPI001D15B830|nr:MarR family transcriptional regulator [Nocardia spumae]